MAPQFCRLLAMSQKKFRGLCTNGCGNAIKTGARRYCSLRCHQEDRHKKRLTIFLRGEYPPVTNTIGFLRRVLLERHGELCSRCGWAERNPITKRVPVEVEHIDGNWTNNHPDNLTLVCPNCHSLTATFRNLNRGRGLEYRAAHYRPSPRRRAEGFKNRMRVATSGEDERDAGVQ